MQERKEDILDSTPALLSLPLKKQLSKILKNEMSC